MRGPSLKSLVMLAGAATIAACTAPAVPGRPTPLLPAAILVRTAGHVERTPLEDYVLGSALAEVSPVGESADTVERIFEVQAILARTYAAAHLGRHASEGFDLCDSTHCQLYDPARIRTSRFAGVAREAVQRTAGEIVVFEGRPANTVFHADCGGATANAVDVWGGAPLPYLVGGPDDVPAGTHRQWRIEVPASKIRAALDAHVDTAVGRRLDAVRVVRTDASGRAAEIEVRGEITRRLRGDDFRRALDDALGERTLLSTRFVVTRAGSAYRFTGTGYGHGVGLCQVGAAARARRGDSVAAILAAYFPGTTLERRSPGDALEP